MACEWLSCLSAAHLSAPAWISVRTAWCKCGACSAPSSISRCSAVAPSSADPGCAGVLNASLTVLGSSELASSSSTCAHERGYAAAASAAACNGVPCSGTLSNTANDAAVRKAFCDCGDVGGFACVLPWPSVAAGTGTAAIAVRTAAVRTAVAASESTAGGTASTAASKGLTEALHVVSPWRPVLPRLFTLNRLRFLLLGGSSTATACCVQCKLSAGLAAAWDEEVITNCSTSTMERGDVLVSWLGGDVGVSCRNILHQHEGGHAVE